MAMKTSGSISLSEVQVEFGGSNPISLNEYYSAAAGLPASGTISLQNFYGKVKPISFNVAKNQCFDDYATLYYDGAGSFYIESRQPDGSIHTGRGDCGGNPQGQIFYYSFNTTGFSNISFSCYESGRDGTTTYTATWPVNSANRVRLGVTDGDGGASTYYFNLYGTIS